VAIDPRSDRPVYRQLADLLHDEISAGRLAPDTLLPSETQLVTRYKVGREAVRQAVAILRAEGLVRTERGIGTRVRRPADRAPVKLGPGDTAVARMPSNRERREYDLDEGVPVIEVRRAAGPVEIHAGDRTEIAG
jgi:DNA-binding FadR family transcriptional regulator